MTTKTQIIKYLTITLLVATIICLGPLRDQFSVSGAASATLGSNQVGTATVSFAANKDATKVQLFQPGTVQNVTVYFANAGFSAKTAIYGDVNGVPAGLLVQSGTQTVSKAGWNTFTLTSTALPEGNYWLTVVTNGRKAQGRSLNTNTPNQHYQRSTSFSSEFSAQFINTAGSSGGSETIINSYATSIYATYIPANPTSSSAPSQTPTPSATPTPDQQTTGNLEVLGNNQVGNVVTSFGTSKDATRFLLVESGEAQNISVYFGSYGYKAKAAIYRDVNGEPASLVCQSGTQAITNAGWATFALSPTMLQPGNYWLAVVADSRKAQGRSISTSTPNLHRQVKTTFSAEFAASFSSLGLSGGRALNDCYATCIYVSFASVSPSPSPSASPSPSSSPTPTPSAPVQNALIGLYADLGCTDVISYIQWGSLEAGSTKSIVLYVRNEGNTAITLSKTLTNVYPADITKYFTFGWDYANQHLSPSAVLRVTLNLTAAANVPAAMAFSFDTVITATA